CDLDLRLRLADLSWRTDVLRRPDRPQAHCRPAVVLRQGNQRSVAGAGAAVEEAGSGRQDLRVAGCGQEGGVMLAATASLSPGLVRHPPLLRGRGREGNICALCIAGSPPSLTLCHKVGGY